MPTDEQLDRLAAAALRLRQTVDAIVSFGSDSPENVRQRAGQIVGDEDEYRAALEDVAASS